MREVLSELVEAERSGGAWGAMRELAEELLVLDPLDEGADPREVVAGGGDFGDAFPDYQWQVEIGETEIELLKKIILTVTNSRMAVRNTYRLVLYKVVL